MMMTNKFKLMGVVSALALGTTMSVASADVLISDFSSFSQTGTYVDWTNPGVSTFTSGATDWRVEAPDTGGGWVTTAAQVDASAEDTIEITLTVNAANVASAFNLVMFSGAPGSTQAGWTFNPVPGTQTLIADLNTPDFFNAGDIVSWDKSDIGNEWHLQGTWSGAYMDMTFDNLVLTPEPASLGLLGLGGLVMAGRRRR